MVMNKCPSGLSVPSTEVEVSSDGAPVVCLGQDGQWEISPKVRIGSKEGSRDWGEGFRTQHIRSPNPAPPPPCWKCAWTLGLPGTEAAFTPRRTGTLPYVYCSHTAGGHPSGISLHEAVMERPRTGFVSVGTPSILFLSHNAGLVRTNDHLKFSALLW